jgi:hypothetical protein
MDERGLSRGGPGAVAAAVPRDVVAHDDEPPPLVPASGFPVPDFGGSLRGAAPRAPATVPSAVPLLNFRAETVAETVRRIESTIISGSSAALPDHHDAGGSAFSATLPATRETELPAGISPSVAYGCEAISCDGATDSELGSLVRQNPELSAASRRFFASALQDA